MAWLKKCCYAAARADELARNTKMARTFIDIPVLL
jgi:hypothetical protein